MLDRLTRLELKTLIGTPVRKSQEEWLQRHGWPYDLDFIGNPIVLRCVALEKLGGKPLPKVWVPDDRNVA